MRMEPIGPEPSAGAGNRATDPADRTWAAFAHIGPVAGYFVLFGRILLPFLILVTEGGRSPFVRENVRRALNFQISVTLYAVGGAILFAVGRLVRPVLLLARGNAILRSHGDMPRAALHQAGLMAGFMALGFLAAGAFVLFNLLCILLAAGRAIRGETFRYPLAIPFVR